MKSVLFILSVILGLCAVVCLIGSIVIDRVDIDFNVNASVVFATGFCCAIGAGLLAIARGWWYGIDQKFWTL